MRFISKDSATKNGQALGALWGLLSLLPFPEAISGNNLLGWTLFFPSRFSAAILDYVFPEGLEMIGFLLFLVFSVVVGTLIGFGIGKFANSRRR